MSEQTTEAIAQSRIGKRPLVLPAGVEVKVSAAEFSVKGPKGTIAKKLPTGVTIKVDGKTVTVGLDATAGRDGKKFQGLVRALLGGMVEGAASGFATSLDFYGVGYRAEVKGTELHMALGLSHPVHYALPTGITARVETIDEAGTKRPRVHLSSHDKELLGRVAARIKSFRPPEPYKGKGVRFTGEKIREKAGKAGGKK